MQEYLVIARKYRPQVFKDIVGQNEVVITLKNSIKNNRTAHAYLFSGPRGIGKTTLARIFAKALNCKNIREDQEPCNECSSCKEITSSLSLDVIEIDGASNRGIDDIRELNEAINYTPSSGKYKIYIIDEVHMLTKEAFNALLKTLEEPPKTVKFLFATTEPQKVLSTIVSRCQRFDLSRISNDIIAKTLKKIVNNVEREVDEEALSLIANLSEGSLRDAESFLDQILCYKEGKITESIVTQIFGIAAKEDFFNLDLAVKDNNLSYAFDLIEKLFKTGKDYNFFLEGLIDHYRTILSLKMNSTLISSEEYQKAALLYTREECIQILDLLINFASTFQKNLFKRANLEMLLIKIISLKGQISLTSLTKRLIDLESKLTTEAKPAKQLEAIPFDITPKKTSKNPQYYYDNLLQFTSEELDGTVQKE